MTTSSSNNTFIENGVLYLVPTLTSDVIGREAIFDSFTFNLTDCTNVNGTSCGAVSNRTTRSVINPVQSSRIITKNATSTANIRYGKVEVVAKMPTGDWIWPAIWMLPTEPKIVPVALTFVAIFSDTPSNLAANSSASFLIFSSL